MRLTKCKVGMRARVGKFKRDGKTPHPQAGKTGTVTHLHYIVSDAPTAHLLIDNGFKGAGTYAIVSIECLEET